MQSYTLEEARRIVMKCAKQYQTNLLGKKFIFIYRDRSDNQVKAFELKFERGNYQHLTGIELIDEDGNVREHVSELFYSKCLNNKLSKEEIQFKKNGTTNLKLLALPVMMGIHKVTKIAGDFDYSRPYLVADKVIGNVNFCLGLRLADEYYVPTSEPDFGGMHIVDLKRSDVRAFYNHLADSQHVKVNIIDNIHTVLHQVLELGVEDHYLRYNPSDNALKELKKAHNNDSGKRRALTVPEQELFEQYLSKNGQYHRWYPIFVVMMWT